MLHSTKAKTFFAVCIPLLLLCTSGCMTAPQSGLSGRGAHCLFPLQGWLGRCDPVCVVDPVCYGYDATCWAPWPEQCEGCPVDRMQQIETEADVTGHDETNAGGGPHPTSAPEEPDSPDSNTVDWNLLPVPDSTGGEGQGEAASPPQGDQGNGVYSPFREDEPRSGEDGDTASPPGTKRQAAPEIEELPPQPPMEDGTRVEASTSTLRFASFSTSESLAPNLPRSASHVSRNEVDATKQDAPKQDPFAKGEHQAWLPAPAEVGWIASPSCKDARTACKSHTVRTLKPPPRYKSPACEQPERFQILEAIRTSFSPPAPRVLPGKVKAVQIPGS